MQPKSKKIIFTAMISLFMLSMFYIAIPLTLAQPSLNLNPTIGPSETIVIINGNGFAARTYRVYFDTNGNGGYNFGEPYRTVSVGAPGTFTTTLTVPSVPPGLYYIRADVSPYASPAIASAQFTVCTIWEGVEAIEDKLDRKLTRSYGEEEMWLEDFGNGVEWSNSDAKFGDYSVHFIGSGTTGDHGSAIWIPVNIKLGDIVSGSYWTKLIDTTDPLHPVLNDYPYDPLIVLLIDANGDGEYTHSAGTDDYLFGEPIYYDDGTAGDGVGYVRNNQWRKWDWATDPDFLFWDHAARPGYPPNALKPLSWYLNNNDDGTLTNDDRWASPPEGWPKTDGIDITGDMTVLYIVIEVWFPYEAYVDDLVITVEDGTFVIDTGSIITGTKIVERFYPMEP